ncbi:MAG: hypothetical protein KDB23_19805 [Planctomycetales bacterium]|nr:hypothetical protein [Planctomycetales bacterium]
MLVEQAVFTSARSRKSQGYHLVAASQGLDENVLRALIKWGPSHASLTSSAANAESFNYHALTDNWQAVSRTVYGGPEYSRRGGLQVFTHYLLLRTEQWAGYDNNPMALARTAQLLGHLRLHIVTHDVLPQVELPDTAISVGTRAVSLLSIPLQEILQILRLQDRLALIGCPDPAAAVGLLIREFPYNERLRLTFTTGLKLSIDREFRLLFASQADTQLNVQLKSQGIDSVLCA